MAMKQKISSYYHQCVRVWRLLRKPSMAEFKIISKVSVIGLLVIGALGFLIALVMNPIF